MMKSLVVQLIRGYQRFFSPDQGVFYRRPTCTMYPTCSEYTVVSIEKYGVIKGFIRGILRILRCHPFQKQLVDMP